MNLHVLDDAGIKQKTIELLSENEENCIANKRPKIFEDEDELIIDLWSEILENDAIYNN